MHAACWHATPAPQPLPGDTPRVAWRWEGRIPRSLFESVPFILRDRHGCHHCTYVLRYKVLGGRLFADAARRCVGRCSSKRTAACLIGSPLLVAECANWPQPADTCCGLVSAAPRRRDLSGQEEDAEVIEEVMLAALHMFKVGGAGADTRVLHRLKLQCVYLLQFAWIRPQA